MNNLKIYNILFKKNKQYSFVMLYITYWGCDSYHWIRIHKKSWTSLYSSKTINGDSWFTVLFNNGKISVNKY